MKRRDVVSIIMFYLHIVTMTNKVTRTRIKDPFEECISQHEQLRKKQ